MQAINRFLYGPTPEERVRAWQAKLRSEQRHLDREMRQVGIYAAYNVLLCPGLDLLAGSLT
jgi:charged multivesicular body protein 3